MTTNIERFKIILSDQYSQLFKNKEYALAAKLQTPESLANKMTDGILEGTAGHDGKGIKNTCKALGLKCTLKDIKEYLSNPLES